MAEAKREGGLYYDARGRAVDAQGNLVKDAPKQPRDTPRDQQPGAQGAATPEERMGIAIAKALRGDTETSGSSGSNAPKSADEDDDGDEGVELPTVEKLERKLKRMKDADEIRAMQAKDDRVTAQPLYDARLAELEPTKE